jgi:hypothetical protein
MRLVSSTTRKFLGTLIFTIACISISNAQENSPYSRYGLGDVISNSNIYNRGMGGIGAAVGSDRFINNLNPASYAFIGDKLVKRGVNGKLVVFDVGTEFNARTLRQQSPTGKYTSRNLYFNYMQLGMQIGKKGNWGLNFGLMPLTRESYKIESIKRTAGVDSLQTVYEGNGGAYQALLGTGYRIKNLSFGINTGYIFGRKESQTALNLLNDTVFYFQSNSSTRATYGNVFLQTGVMYDRIYPGKGTGKDRRLRIGGYYHLKKNLRASQDVSRVTFDQFGNAPVASPDSIYVKTGEKGKIVFPSTIGLGFSYEKEDAFLVGADFTTTNWTAYRYYGQPDVLQNSWMLKTGVQVIPNAESKNYWQKVAYRSGFYYGQDYIKAGGASMPLYAFTFGMSLPTSNVPFNRDFREGSKAVPYINLAVEAGRRGDNKVNLRENFVRVSLSFSLSSLWFFRYKYD